jgi:hypothetical protein
LFSFRVFLIMSLVSWTGMFVYRFEMSSEAKVDWGSMGVFCNFLISSLVFPSVCVLGSGAINLIFCVNSRASLKPGAPLQLTTGRIRCSGLCILISPLMDGAVGFKFVSCVLCWPG